MPSPIDKPKKPKDPARPTRAKAAREPVKPLAPALAKLLNPGIGKGTAGVGAQTGIEPGARSEGAAHPQTGIQPPPDNSFERRADFANAHKARASTPKGFGEDKQSGYVGKSPSKRSAEPLGGPVTGPLLSLAKLKPGFSELDPDIAETAGFQRPDDEGELLARPEQDRGTPLGVAATAQSLERLLREGRPEFTDATWVPHRPPRPEKSEGGRRLVIQSELAPKGDQPTAIADLVEGIKRHDRTQVLLGVTGSGKTFTMAQVIEATQRPALILAPNKTLAAQLYGEFKN